MYLWDGRNIYFMGFMATGKSKVGRELARLLGWSFTDTDSLVEQQAGKSISRIFADEGEPQFRQLESKVIQDIAGRKQWVIALGGGAIMNDGNWQLISQSGITICLNASVDVLCRRIAEKDHRPLMANASAEEQRQRILSLMEKRSPYYEKAQYHFESREDVAAKDLAQQIFLFLRDEP